MSLPFRSQRVPMKLAVIGLFPLIWPIAEMYNNRVSFLAIIVNSTMRTQ